MATVINRNIKMRHSIYWFQDHFRKTSSVFPFQKDKEVVVVVGVINVIAINSR